MRHTLSRVKDPKPCRVSGSGQHRAGASGHSALSFRLSYEI